MLVIVDTNVLINAIFARRLYRFDSAIVDLEQQRAIQFAFSTYTKNELLLIVSRFIHQQNHYECSLFFDELYAVFNRSRMEPINPPKVETTINDKSDLPFLNLAVKVQADYLITNDYESGLLNLGTFKNVKIVDPKRFISDHSKLARKR
ncbi:putative toxin-antitoxin system toxin component, PIN family [Brevibacillus centrosporus]|uniref:putative toxin-antitoxin system toxin component, PIN family n=1 Tax=Brevibacillus centrosporus TaxID=54910 RepID=UPI002E1D8EF8|nr:putative toxin-antitoxin system toxin component, PIN family [Brevibacillus centrosporus]MED1953780.1 putative toxin-antitoxin system toxin component, PIN family [Brevibacillus centrosporus]